MSASTNHLSAGVGDPNSIHSETEMGATSNAGVVADTSGFSPSSWWELDQDPLQRAEAIVSS